MTHLEIENSYLDMLFHRRRQKWRRLMSLDYPVTVTAFLIMNRKDIIPEHWKTSSVASRYQKLWNDRWRS